MSIYAGLSPLTRVPLSDAVLPSLDPPKPPWPGEEVTAGGVTLYVRRTPGSAEETAIYVHGLNGSATNWTDLAWLLSGHPGGGAGEPPRVGRAAPTPAGPDSPPRT